MMNNEYFLMDGVVMQEFLTRKVSPVFLISVLHGKGRKLGLCPSKISLEQLGYTGLSSTYTYRLPHLLVPAARHRDRFANSFLSARLWGWP